MDLYSSHFYTGKAENQQKWRKSTKMRKKQIPKISRLNYKKLVFKRIIIKDVVEKLNEIIDVVNKLSNRKTKVITKVITSKKTNTGNPPCPKCKSTNTIKRGKRYNLERGYTQKYGCKDCGYKFTPKTKEYRMRVSETKINKAIELFNQGYSYSQIAKKVKGVSRQTICRWLKKYKVPKKDKVIEREVKNQYGTYKRKFNIKYKKEK